MPKIEVKKITRATPSWIGIYSGLITVLLCFFVFMLADASNQKIGAISIVQEVNEINNSDSAESTEKVNKMPDVEKEETEHSDGTLLNSANSIDYSSIADEIKQKLNDKGVSLEEGEMNIASDGLIIRLPSTFLFDSGKAVLRKEAATKINAIASVISESFNDLNIEIEGHTDNLPVKSNQFPSNWELSSARAIAVATCFVKTYHVDAKRVEAIGYGENRPIASNDTIEGRVINRRIEIKLISKK